MSALQNQHTAIKRQPTEVVPGASPIADVIHFLASRCNSLVIAITNSYYKFVLLALQ